jgi:hypothetical protein
MGRSVAVAVVVVMIGFLSGLAIAYVFSVPQ